MEYVAVLDLGTSKMLALAASKNDRSKIVASESVSSENCIRRGLIHNRDHAPARLMNLITKFNISLHSGLKKIYVGIGGQSLHTQEITIRKELNGERLSPAMINEIENECAAYSDDAFVSFEYFPPEYYIDGRLESYPEGVSGGQVTAKCLLIAGNPKLKSELDNLIAKARMEIAGIFIAPIATAEAVLTMKEKEIGCALVELGAGVSYLSIYKGGSLRYLVTIPLGGNTITNDIKSVLNLTEVEAEERKKKEGNLLAEASEDPIHPIIEARAEEIIANIVRQIETSGYGAGVNALVMTGGASQLRNLDKLLEQKSGKTVRRITDNPEQSCALGMLQWGKENCGKEQAIRPASSPKPEPELDSTPRQQPKPDKKPLKERVQDKVKGFAGSLFD